MVLRFWTERSGQTVQSQIRLLLEESDRVLLEEQSGQDLHCLPFHLHVRATVLKFKDDYSNLWVSEYLGSLW